MGGCNVIPLIGTPVYTFTVPIIVELWKSGHGAPCVLPYAFTIACEAAAVTWHQLSVGV